MSPVCFREYSNDIPACMYNEYQEWLKGTEEDEEIRGSPTKPKTSESPITRALADKPEINRTKEEKWDEHLRSMIDIDEWRTEKTSIGPEQKTCSKFRGIFF